MVRSRAQRGVSNHFAVAPQRRFLQARRVPYQRVIRTLVDAYAEKQVGK
jgi:hypothetical protein